MGFSPFVCADPPEHLDLPEDVVLKSFLYEQYKTNLLVSSMTAFS